MAIDTDDDKRIVYPFQGFITDVNILNTENEVHK